MIKINNNRASVVMPGIRIDKGFSSMSNKDWDKIKDNKLIQLKLDRGELVVLSNREIKKHDRLMVLDVEEPKEDKPKETIRLDDVSTSDMSASDAKKWIKETDDLSLIEAATVGEERRSVLRVLSDKLS